MALVTEQGYSVAEAAASLNITDKLLYNWVAKLKLQNEDSELSKDERAELIQLRKDNMCWSSPTGHFSKGMFILNG